jgi:hypothetical protein
MFNEMEKRQIEYDEIEEIKDFLESDYCNFNLSMLAQKIKSNTYRPKPKMLYL